VIKDSVARTMATVFSQRHWNSCVFALPSMLHSRVKLSPQNQPRKQKDCQGQWISATGVSSPETYYEFPNDD
jgi:hypothetical protein